MKYVIISKWIKVHHIKKPVDQLFWEKPFINLPINVNDITFLFNKMVKNVFSNYIPHERVPCDNRDLPWFNENVKQLILEKNDTCKKYVKENKDLQILGISKPTEFVN